MVPLSFSVGCKAGSAEYITDGLRFEDDNLLDFNCCSYLSTGITRDPSRVSAAWAGIQYKP